MQRAANVARRAFAVAFLGHGDRIVGHGEDRAQAQLAAGRVDRVDPREQGSR